MAEQRPTYVFPTLSLGFAVAFIVAVVACILWGLGQLERDWALAILAVCATRL